MSDLRDKFTKNAEEFDSLMVEMLAENMGLKSAANELLKTLSDFIDAGLLDLHGDDCAAMCIAGKLAKLEALCDRKA